MSVHDASHAHPVPRLDALIIGLGFSGVYLLHNLRKQGFNVLAVTASSDLGGVWAHNIYPGSRVDIEGPTYELDIDELWDGTMEQGWKWEERFPAREELEAYFRWVGERLRLGRGSGDTENGKGGCVFDSWVEKAVWDEGERLWEVGARDGRTWKARYFLPCVGYAAKPYLPDIKGLEYFQGIWTHTAQWPREGIELEGKRVGVIGTGSTGVQVIQTIAPKVKHLSVFQQTPATALPMQQRKLKLEDSTKSSVEEKRRFLNHRKFQWDGAKGSMIPRSAKDDSPSQSETEWSRLWDQGGFAFWTSNYMDLFSDQESNTLIYNEWKRRVRQRINDPIKQEILAPSVPPYAFGTKRVTLEESYYETFNLPHVSLINARADPIVEITPEGVITQSASIHEFDVLILATGFDVSTGSLTQIDIRGTNGTTLESKWSREITTYLGMTVPSFPNMLFPYGPHSPSNTCNGALCAELQGHWITSLLCHLRSSNKSRVEPQSTASDAWTELVTGLLPKDSLFARTKSYYFGDNIPRRNAKKKRQPLFWFGGVPAYVERCEQVKNEGWKGFDIQ